MAIFFYIAAIVAVAAALSVVLEHRPVYSALSLIVVLCALAVIYLLLGAEFMAVIQVIVYAGAIMVLFVLVIMLLNAGREAAIDRSRVARWLGPPLLAAFVAEVLVVVWRGFPASSTAPAAQACGSEVEGLNMVPLPHILALSVILFGLGITGFIIRRNVITIFMCIELMLNAVNLAFVAFSRQRGNLDGQLFVFFVIVVA